MTPLTNEFRNYRILMSQYQSEIARHEKAKKLLQSLTDKKADRLAEDMDHRCKDHSAWYRAVKRGRKFLEAEKKRDT